MPKTSAVNETIVHSVRLSKTDKVWLDRQAKASGFELQQLIRHAIEALRSSVEHHDGQLIVPVRIRQWIDAEKAKEVADATLAAVTNERDHLREQVSGIIKQVSIELWHAAKQTPNPGNARSGVAISALFGLGLPTSSATPAGRS